MIQGGMTHISNGKFAAACSNEGILGVIGSGGMSIAQLQEEIITCRGLTDMPFGVNIVMTRPDIDELSDLVITEHVPIVITGDGNALHYVKKWKDAKVKVISVIGVPQAAKFAERSGVDILVAEGLESGGHIGTLTTMTLVPQVCDSVKIPVVAAGGIADHRQYMAAMALGACGVQVGTALLASSECPIHHAFKDVLFSAKSTDSVVIGSSIRKPVRVIANNMSKTYIEMEHGGETIDALTDFAKGTLRAAVQNGDITRGCFMAGLDCGQIVKERPLSDIINSIIRGE